MVIFEGGRDEGVCVIVERGRGKEEGREGVCVIVEKAGGGSSLSIGPVPRTPTSVRAWD